MTDKWEERAREWMAFHHGPTVQELAAEFRAIDAEAREECWCPSSIDRANEYIRELGCGPEISKPDQVPEAIARIAQYANAQREKGRKEGRREEREACAQLCEDESSQWLELSTAGFNVAGRCAAAIRARGKE